MLILSNIFLIRLFSKLLSNVNTRIKESWCASQQTNDVDLTSSVCWGVSTIHTPTRFRFNLGTVSQPIAGSTPTNCLRRWPNTTPTPGLLYTWRQHPSKHVPLTQYCYNTALGDCPVFAWTAMRVTLFSSRRFFFLAFFKHATTWPIVIFGMFIRTVSQKCQPFLTHNIPWWHRKALTHWPPFLNVIFLIRSKVYASWKNLVFIGTWNIRFNFMAFLVGSASVVFTQLAVETKWRSVWLGQRKLGHKHIILQ